MFLLKGLLNPETANTFNYLWKVISVDCEYASQIPGKVNRVCECSMAYLPLEDIVNCAIRRDQADFIPESSKRFISRYSSSQGCAISWDLAIIALLHFFRLHVPPHSQHILGRNWEYSRYLLLLSIIVPAVLDFIISLGLNFIQFPQTNSLLPMGLPVGLWLIHHYLLVFLHLGHY